MYLTTALFAHCYMNPYLCHFLQIDPKKAVPLSQRPPSMHSSQTSVRAHIIANQYCSMTWCMLGVCCSAGLCADVWFRL